MSSSGEVGKFFELDAKFTRVKTLNYRYAFSDLQVVALREITGVRVIKTGDANVPGYKHVISRTAKETAMRLIAGTVKKIHVEEAVKFGETIRDYSPVKHKDTVLRAWFPSDTMGELFEAKFNKDFHDSKIAAAAKSHGYTIDDITFEPAECVPMGKHKVRLMVDAGYYVPWQNLIANYDVGDKLILTFWDLPLGEHFGEIKVEESEELDAFGRECHKWTIVGEESAIYHAPLKLVNGPAHERVVGWSYAEDSFDPEVLAAMPHVGADVYANIESFMGMDGLYKVKVITKLSPEAYAKVTAASRPLDFAALKAKSRAARSAAFASPESSESSGSSVEDAVPARKPRTVLNAKQIAARVDAEYRDPKVTVSRIRQLVLDNYPDIEIEPMSEMVEEIMGMVASAMLRRKALRGPLAEGVLAEWQAFVEPGKFSTGFFSTIKGWAVQGAKTVSNGTTGAVKGAAVRTKQFVSKKGSESRKNWGAGNVIGAIMPILAVFAVGIIMASFMAVMFTFTAKMYRSTVRAAGVAGAVATGLSSVAAMADSDGEDFLTRAKNAMIGLGAMATAATGAAKAAAN